MSWHDEYQVWLTESQSLANAQNVVDHLYGSTDWSRASICALLGNMRHESSINPDMYEYGYAWSADRGYGLVQWTPRSKYWDWAVARGLNPRDGDSQLDRIDYEVANNIQWIPRSDYDGMTFAQFRANTGGWSIAYLTEAFTWGYERPNTQAGWNSMPGRKSFASLAYNRLDWSGGGGSDPDPDDEPIPTEPGTAPRDISLTYVEVLGDHLSAHFSNGKQVMAYPSTAGRWIAKSNAVGSVEGGGGGGAPGDTSPDPGDEPEPTGEFADVHDNMRCTNRWGTAGYSATGYHTGIDLGANRRGVAGDPLYAMADGTVVRTGGHQQVLYGHSGYGVLLDIGEHGGVNYWVFYGHLNSIDVRQGQKVVAGQQIATMGGTGANHSNTDFGVHLHLSVLKGITVNTSGATIATQSQFIDPVPFMRSHGIAQNMSACP